MNTPLSPQPDTVARTAPESVSSRGSMDLALLVESPGAVRACRSPAALGAGLFFGWGLLVGGGIVGGTLYSYLQNNADLLLIPLVLIYVGFAFWLYGPVGYRFTEKEFEVIRPRGIWALPGKTLLARSGSELLWRTLAERVGAPWLLEIPLVESRPAGASHRLWFDPDLQVQEPDAGAGAGLRADLWAVPLSGAYLLWGGVSGRFWRPGAGTEWRFARRYRPRLSFWVE